MRLLETLSTPYSVETYFCRVTPIQHILTFLYPHSLIDSFTALLAQLDLSDEEMGIVSDGLPPANVFVPPHDPAITETGNEIIGGVGAGAASSSSSAKLRPPTFPIKMALCGLSEHAKAALANALYTQFDRTVRLISCQDLVQQADTRGRELIASNTYTEVDMELPPLSSTELLMLAQDGDDRLALWVLSSLRAGEAIRDELYVALIVRAICALGQEQQRNQYLTARLVDHGYTIPKALSAEIKGYILRDFPNTKQQALLLVEALSGINYDEHKPQPSDKISPFAPAKPSEMEKHDVALCGLDSVIFINSPMFDRTDFDHDYMFHVVSQKLLSPQIQSYSNLLIIFI